MMGCDSSEHTVGMIPSLLKGQGFIPTKFFSHVCLVKAQSLLKEVNSCNRYNSILAKAAFGY